ERFFDEVAAMPCSTGVAAALQKRIGKNRENLFTFLHCDGVPWNNNNAEHAVRAFTRLRNTMASSTAKGTADYCILLSVQQTLRYRGIGFLDFLKSGKTEIAG
ncbi:MAG TPA: transposase, partial [Acetobacteraceae bacterium]|nr:transposase [Acetobacteraceae bacterium]